MNIVDRNVFISYGHGDYDHLARALADDLRKKGYNVFLDVDFLKEGDWERIIDEHILASKYFLFLSSVRSTSGEGYCLNELCRAGENNSTIIPIMLDDSRIPLSINKYQRLSFRECLTDKKEILEGPYRAVVEQIADILCGKATLSFSDADARLKSQLHPISSRDFLFRYYDSFCGREDAFQQFEKFLASNKTFFWVAAKPGCGKTALSSMLLWRYPEHICAAHFCKFNNSDRANPKYIITSIAYQLAMAIPEYKAKLLDLLSLDTVFEKNATRIFEYLLVEPTTDIKFSKPVVIVIDALDECSWRGDNEICSLLQRMRERIPSWMKFVLTSRDEADIHRYLQHIAVKYVLSEKETEKDLRLYYRKEFPDAPEDRIDVLLAKSEGSFLYANEIVKQIREDNLSLDDINFFPVGIYGFFNDWFSRLFGAASGRDVSYNDVKPILEFLCISTEPVHAGFLEEYLQMDEYRLKELLSLISGLFPIKNQCIEPLHKSIIDWLTDSSDISHTFYISKRKGYERLLNFIEGKYAAGRYEDHYVVRYFGSTLLALKRYDRLEEILDDPVLQETIIEKMPFDSGLERYLFELECLKQEKPKSCIALLNRETFIKIFSDNRRLLYNSGMFFILKKIGLTQALASEDRDWGVEGEIGKVFYYYIVERFQKAIQKAKLLLASRPEVQEDCTLQAELYNVKGLSERKLVLFDDALESFQKCIECSEQNMSAKREHSDAEFELSLAYLIISKINLHMQDFTASNRNGKKAIKILTRKIDEMPDSDKKTANILFLAEDYRVTANSFIWQEEYDEAEDRLKSCEEIYRQQNNTTDRYFIRFRYTSLLLQIMRREFEGVIPQLEHLRDHDAKSAYDRGTLHFYIALCIYLQNTQDPQMLTRGLEQAKAGVKTFDSIDSLLEKAECNLLAIKLAKLAGARYLSDDDDYEYIDNWIAHLEGVIERVRNGQ